MGSIAISASALVLSVDMHCLHGRLLLRLPVSTKTLLFLPFLETSSAES